MRTVYSIQTRLVVRRRAQRAPWPLMALFLLLALVLFCVGVGEVLQQRALDSRGVTVRGTVVGLYHSGGKGGHTDATYQFEAGGVTYQGKCGVTYPFYRSVSFGDSIPVTYLPESPRTSRCAESTEYRKAYTMTVTSGIMGALLVVCMLPGRRGPRLN